MGKPERVTTKRLLEYLVGDIVDESDYFGGWSGN